MIGFGFALTLPVRRGGGVSNPAQSEATAYLPALTTAGAGYQSVYSNARLLSDYTGPLVQAGTDLGAGQPSVPASEVQAARGAGDALRIAGWYDQSGNARHAIAASDAERPALHEDVAIGDVPAMLFDGRRLGDPRGPQHRRVSAAVVLTANDCTVAYVIDPTVSIQEQYYFELVNAAGSATLLGHLQYPGAQFGGALPDVHGNIAINTAAALGVNCGRKIATVPQVMILRSTPAGLDVFIDGAKIATLAALSGTAATLYVGMASDPALTVYIPNCRFGCFLTIDKGVNDADVAAIAAALMTRFAIPGSYDAVVATIGTSRVAGGAISTLTRTKEWFERGHYGARRVKTYNLGMDGRALSYHYANRAAWAMELADPGRPTVFVIDDAINDLGGLGASTDPAAIYATYGDYRAALATLGANVRVVFATCLPQSSGIYAGLTGRSDAAIDADREALNTAIRANAAGAAAIADPAASPTMGLYPTSSDTISRYPDKLHPSSAGYALLAPFNPAATLLTLV